MKPKTVLASIVICGAVCLSGIGYVWSKTQVWGLSRDIKKLEVRLEELKRNNDVLQRTYAAMCAPATLQVRAQQLNLGLAAPLPNQIVRMPIEPVPLVEKQSGQRFYARKTND